MDSRVKRSPKTGRFVRTVESWDYSRWDEGHKVKGRFRVYRPDCPRAHGDGYAQRAHVVWWIETGECHPKGTVIHHADGNILNDHISNLQMMKHEEHTAYHCRKNGIRFLCHECGREFWLPGWRVRQREKEGYPPKYCSQPCYRGNNKHG